MSGSPRTRRICVVTDSRAEYGLLYWLMRDLQTDPQIDLQVAVCGAHLSPEFGNTHKVVEDDGFPIDAKVEMTVSGDTPTAIAKSMGLGCIGFADAYERLCPDIVVVLGDRYEMLVAAQVAMILRLPIAHIHGGETTEAAVDEAIRHAITKMAQLHFTSADVHRRRVIQLGEHPTRVFNTGAPGLDHALRTELLDLEELSKSIDFDPGERFFAITYHPVTLHDDDPAVAMGMLLEALSEFPEHKFVFTGTNTDHGGRGLFRAIDNFVAADTDRSIFINSLGQVRYLSALRHAEAVIGNSSSGLIEAPTFFTPTVNMGDRQRGRLRAASVIDCAEDTPSIAAAIRRAISPEFNAGIKDQINPYGSGNAAQKIVAHLKTVELDGLIMKRFHDMPETDLAVN
jgi:UDP-hydrolysing UDP-N-acetyl-D-glucosamine 2-epimerase